MRTITRHTSKAEKRQWLLHYIVEFTSEIYGISGMSYKMAYNKAWDKMWAKIDKLKLFIATFLILSAFSSITRASDFKFIDINHPQIITGIFADLKDHQDAGGSLALISYISGEWTPLAIGATLGKGLGGPSLAIGTSVNLLPSMKAGALAVIDALTNQDQFRNIKAILAPPSAGQPDITMSLGPHWSLVFVDNFKTKGMFTLFYGAAWRF